MAKQLLTCSLLFFLLPLIGQDAFERIYRSDSNLAGVEIQQTQGGDYLALSIHLDENLLPGKKVNVTKLSPKGDLIWSKNYTFDTTLALTGSISILPGGNFAFTTVELQPSMNKLLVVADSQGDTLWTKAYGRDDSVLPVGWLSASFVIGHENEKLNFFSNIHSNNAINEPYLAGLDSLGNIEWAHVLENEIDLSTRLTDVEETIDTGYIISGTGFSGGVLRGVLIKTDSLGIVEWSRSYNDLDPMREVRFSAVHPTADTGYMVVGDVIGVASSNYEGSLITQLDSLGKPVWISFVDDPAPNLETTFLFNVTKLKESNEIIISGARQLSPDVGNQLFMMQITPDTFFNIGWQKLYSSNVDLGYAQTSLVSTEDGGAASFSYRSLNPILETVPYLVKVEADGSSSCEADADITFVEYDLSTDTLIWEAVPIDTVQERMPEVEIFSGFNIPTLSLTPPPPFCEGDPINVTFDATTENAVSYEWTPNGETTPTIVATEAGMYTVDVRIETDICFNLCDTVTISEIGPPMVEILAAGSLCAEGADTLVANASGFVESFLWGTGENTPAIFINEEGSYDVIASNLCGSSSASINLECIFDFEACFAVPNAFTPDGDDANDVFNGIISEDCANAIRVNNLKIWNRWGQVVFESTNGEGWDGSHNGKEAPSDAYLFSLEVENTEEMEVRVITGDLVLLR